MLDASFMERLFLKAGKVDRYMLRSRSDLVLIGINELQELKEASLHPSLEAKQHYAPTRDAALLKPRSY
jgi:hypothetical protein